MELLETQDPEKKRLIESSDRHKRELQKELTAISEKTEVTIKNALIIGGTLAVSYLLITQLGGSKKKKRRTKKKAIIPNDEEEYDTDEVSPHAPSFLSQIGENLASHATLILLDIAKEKLGEYLSKRKNEE
ncbi:MAG: hypothetical protein JNM78_01085 [Cyclobacteriaceae bacterium]|nr:hypothetical protein [Cyclobacteriaceae bacterium]